MKFPRILVVSNNSFSLSNSNGRTLGNMFIGWPKECLSQFCISTDGANFDICDNYYCISDSEIFSAFLLFKKAKGHKLIGVKSEKVSTGVNGQKKTASKTLVRHILWGCNRWKSKEFVGWIVEFNPEVILVQNGDSAFMLSIARKIACARNIPLMMFNTEGYCLFQHDWMERDKLSWLCFPLYKRILHNETRRVMCKMSFIIHGNQLLKEDYDDAYGVPSEVVYTGSDVQWINTPVNTDNPQIVYLGNFGFNRPASLAVVAKVLHSINPEYVINVYGKPSTDQQEKTLNRSEGIIFHGAISYEKVKDIMSKADILIHAEGMDDYYQEALRYGFSTKIADSLSSGRPFLLYSRPEIACAQYIKNTGAGWFASDEAQLREEIVSILKNNEERNRRLNTSRVIAEQNHNEERCRLRFQNAILSRMG